MTEDKKPCYCRRYIVAVADAAIMLRDTPICNLRCLKQAEAARLKEIAAAAGRVS